MLVYLFSLIDILNVLGILFMYFGVGTSVVGVFIFCLFLKSVFFLPNWVSIIDLVVVILLLFGLFGWFNFTLWIVLLWLLQKSVLGLIRF